MTDQLKKIIVVECAVVAGFAAAALIWFVFFLRGVPFLYETLARYGANDYSYLWNGFAVRMQWIACRGGEVIFVLGPVWLIVRLVRRIIRSVLGGHPAAVAPQTRMPAREMLLREAGIALAIVLVAGGTFYFSHRGYVKMKARYFNQVVMSQDGYRALPESEKAKARAQYEAARSDEYVAAMLEDYGMRAKLFYYTQLVTFWLLIWGYPGYLFSRFLFWAKRRLDPESS